MWELYPRSPGRVGPSALPPDTLKIPPPSVDTPTSSRLRPHACAHPVLRGGYEAKTMGSKDRKATGRLGRRAIWWVALGVALALASLLATTNDAQAAGEIDLVLEGQDARS